MPMMSSRTITLFTEPPVPRTGPSAFAVSILLHGGICGLVLLGISRTPHTNDPALARHYAVRLLTLHQPEARPWLAAAAAAAALRGVAHHAPATQGGAPSARMAAPEIPQLEHASQTLVQPDLPQNLLLPRQMRVPTVLMWSPESTAAHVIVAPPLPTLTAVHVRPSLEIPNREQNLADVSIAASTFATQVPTLPTSTTAPLAVAGPQSLEQMPSSASKVQGAPTPARIMSLSDLEMQEGTVALPMASQTASSSTGGFMLGHGLGSSQTGEGRAVGIAGTGSGAGVGKSGEGTAQSDKSAAGSAQVGKAIAGNGSGGDAIAGMGGGNGAAASGVGSPDGQSEPALAHLTRRKDGTFGVVVVGSSIEEAYPETAGMWSGRLAYTVYLHVGLAKSWILQYSLPRSAEMTATRPDAPWPYDMMRPRLEPADFNADAIMVRGIVNTSGRFEQLGVVFPLEFAQAKFLLSALQQWQFRPAMQNGQIAAVEVLLIIPEEAE